MGEGFWSSWFIFVVLWIEEGSMKLERKRKYEGLFCFFLYFNNIIVRGIMIMGFKCKYVYNYFCFYNLFFC